MARKFYIENGLTEVRPAGRSVRFKKIRYGKPVRWSIDFNSRQAVSRYCDMLDYHFGDLAELNGEYE